MTVLDPTGHRLSVSSHGGQMVSWAVPHKGRLLELLHHQPQFTEEDIQLDERGGSLVLFPFAGSQIVGSEQDRFKVQGKVYKIEKHGFALTSEWKLSLGPKSSPPRVTAELQTTSETLRKYPFRFKVRLTYILGKKQVKVLQEFENHSSDPMPVSFGLHPYFKVPFGEKSRREDMVLKGKLLSTSTAGEQKDWTGKTSAPKLPKPIVSQGMEENDFYTPGPWDFTLWDRKEHAGVRQFQPRAGGGLPHTVLVLWSGMTRPSSFYCVEPWFGPTNAANNGQGLQWIPGRKKNKPGYGFSVILMEFLEGRA